jgi:hypothetical protein
VGEVRRQFDFYVFSMSPASRVAAKAKKSTHLSPFAPQLQRYEQGVSGSSRAPFKMEKSPSIRRPGVETLSQHLRKNRG